MNAKSSRVARGLVPRRLKKVATGGDGELKTDEEAPVANTPLVNLRTTLELFGLPGFKVDMYVERRIKDSKEVSGHRDELSTRKVLLNEALKTFVTDNYRKFIHTSKEIEHIEGDMSNLYNTLTHYSGALKKLQDMSFTSEIEDGNITQSMDNDTQDTKPHSTDLLGEVLEELGTLMFESKLDQAVTLITSVMDRINLSDPKKDNVIMAKQAIKGKLEQLIGLLSEATQSDVLKSSERRRYLNHIVQLGYPEKALRLFLQHRRSVLRASYGQIRSTGELTSYITDVSGIIFSTVAMAWIDFRRIFRQPARASAFYRWVIDELYAFDDTFTRLVFQSDSAFRVVCQCVHLAVLSCKVLEKQGMRFSFMLETLFYDALRAAFQSYSIAVRQTVSKSVKAENWEIEQAWVKQSVSSETAEKLSITKSARNLYDTVHQFILDMKLVLINPALFDPTVNDLLPLAISGIRSLFEDYLLAMTAASKSDMISDAQGMSIVANCYFLAEDLFPRIKKQLAGKVDMKRGLSNIAAFHDQLGKFYKAQRDFFFQQRGDVWVRDVIRWPANASAWYKEGGNSDAPVETPSPGFINFGKYLETLQSLAKSCLDAEVPRMQSRAVAEVLSLLRSDAQWSHAPEKFDTRAYRQLVLDMMFTKMAEGGSGHYLDSISRYIGEIVGQARKRLVNPGDASAVDEAWAVTIVDCMPEKSRLSLVSVGDNAAPDRPPAQLVLPARTPRTTRALSTMPSKPKSSSKDL
ncbi:hypothetical protein PBRA_000201 [Plasmodiophora brassicae]|uniref:Exocyst component Exo84 C-terminal domain-containing protein n=1 Tax=Plasmodiophora brassicae TaxID=37360 RepID=A0A0G4IGS1_PLABS|nr:hypothetical protein PBRA_000201 [Plasmodiophora brassicae]